MKCDDHIVELNVELLRDRSRVGQKKYGVTLEKSGLNQEQYLRHALEETLDLANYLQGAIQELEADRQRRGVHMPEEPASCTEDDGCPKELVVLQRYWRESQRRGEPVAPQDESVFNDWVTASDVDGVTYDGPSFERGHQCGVVAELDLLTGTAPEWPDFARMEASLQRLKERLTFENARRNELERKLREQRHER